MSSISLSRFYNNQNPFNDRNPITSVFEKIPHKLVTSIFLFTIPAAKYSVSLARQIGFIPPAHTISEQLAPKVSAFADYIYKSCAQGVTQCSTEGMKAQFINISAIINSVCPLQTYLKDVNQYLDQPISLHDFRLLQLSSIDHFTILIKAPIQEEVLFRNLIQSQIFNTLTKEFVGKFCPGKENLLDSLSAKITRVVVTSLLFSAYHLQNTHFDNTSLSQQLVHTFVLGTFCGILKESTQSDSLPIALHMAYNLVNVYAKTYFDSCHIDPWE